MGSAPLFSSYIWYYSTVSSRDSFFAGQSEKADVLHFPHSSPTCPPSVLVACSLRAHFSMPFRGLSFFLTVPNNVIQKCDVQSHHSTFKRADLKVTALESGQAQPSPCLCYEDVANLFQAPMLQFPSSRPEKSSRVKTCQAVQIPEI
jgi:hypothetical protein